MTSLDHDTRAEHTALHPSGAQGFVRLHSVLVAILALPATAAAPWLWALPTETLAIGATALVLGGVPHGAVDHRVARPMLRPRWGRLWFGLFAVLYLGLAALMLAGWLAAPALSLVLFLVLSVLHFGTEDAEGQGGVARLVRGGLPVALPILLHPERTARFFEILGGPAAGEGSAFWGALALAAWSWTPFAALHAVQLARAREGRALLEVGALGIAFAALPPLAAFAFYFLAVHSPRHAAELARRHAGGWWGALYASLPLTLATLAMGTGLFWALSGDAETRFLRATFWGLAALTLPHMMLHAWDRRRGGGSIG